MEFAEVEVAASALAAANVAARAARQAQADANAAVKLADAQVVEADKEYRRCCNDFAVSLELPPA